MCTSVLEGTLVRLEPLAQEHAAALAAVAHEDRATYGFTVVPDTTDAMAAYVADLLTAADAGEDVPFAQVRASDGRPVGVTRFLAIRRWPDTGLPYAVEIGGTWLAASAQRTGINVEAKLLLLTHAFERWCVGRVDLKTDARNDRSRTAILALGARFEAVLHGWQPSQVAGEEGRLRDTAMYAIVVSDWPAVRDGLAARLRRDEPHPNPSRTSAD
jgi:RimJ/RimL family protein N-acetyltransferase